MTHVGAHPGGCSGVLALCPPLPQPGSASLQQPGPWFPSWDLLYLTATPKSPGCCPGAPALPAAFPGPSLFPPLFKLSCTGPGASTRRLLNSQQGDKRAPGKPSSERLKLRNNEEESSRRAPPPPGGSDIDFQDMQFPLPSSLGSQRAPWRKPFPAPILCFCQD